MDHKDIKLTTYYWYKMVKLGYKSKDVGRGWLWNRSWTAHVQIPHQGKAEERSAFTIWKHIPINFKENMRNNFEILNLTDKELEKFEECNKRRFKDNCEKKGKKLRCQNR